MKPYSGYEFLSFVLPGLIVISVAYYGLYGWVHGEPGAVTVLGITVLAYLAGHVVAAVANWLEPVAWGRVPGTRVSLLEGLRGRSGKYADIADDRLIAWLSDDETDVQRAFDLAYTRMRNSGDTSYLDALNEQIGFYRNTATATLLSLVIVYDLAPKSAGTLPAVITAPLLVVAAVTFTIRYRRFWARFGDVVIRTARTCEARELDSDERDGSDEP